MKNLKRLIACCVSLLFLLCACTPAAAPDEAPQDDQGHEIVEQEIQQPEGITASTGISAGPAQSQASTDMHIVLAAEEPQYTDDLGSTYFFAIPTASGDVASLMHGLDVCESIDELDEVYADYTAPILSAIDAAGDFDSVEVLSDLENKWYIYGNTENYSESFTNYSYVDGYQTASYQASIVLGETGLDSILEYDLTDVIEKFVRYTGIVVDEDELHEMMSLCMEHSGGDNYYIVSVENPVTSDMFSVSVLDYGEELECWHITADHLVQSYISID